MECGRVRASRGACYDDRAALGEQFIAHEGPLHRRASSRKARCQRIARPTDNISTMPNATVHVAYSFIQLLMEKCPAVSYRGFSIYGALSVWT